MALSAFLRTSRAHVSSLKRASPPRHHHAATTQFHVVLGNESADLDSTACAIALAYLRQKLQPLPVTLYWISFAHIFLNIVWLMKNIGVEVESLTFADEVPQMLCFRSQASKIDMPALLAEKRLLISLVDHNKLSQKNLGPAVISCIDHHADEGLYASTMTYKHIEAVGSCASLITEEYLKHKAEAFISPELARLLLSPILIDTYNFDARTTRATPKDREMAAVLKKHLPDSFSSDDLFQNLSREKTDLSRLSSVDLLRRDYKEFEFGAGRIGCSSMPSPLSACFERADFIADMRKYIADRRLLFLLFNTAFTRQDGELGRELLVYRGGGQQGMMDKLLHHLEKSELNLVAHPNGAPSDPNVRVYVQHNLSASRKQLVPIVSAFFSSL